MAGGRRGRTKSSGARPKGRGRTRGTRRPSGVEPPPGGGGDGGDGGEPGDYDEPIGSLRPAGLSLPVKFALVISGVSAVLVIIMGIIVYFQVKKTIDQEIDRRGMNLTLALAVRAAQHKETYDREYKAYYTATTDLNSEIRDADDAARKAELRRKQQTIKDDWEKSTKPRILREMQDFLDAMVFIDAEKKKTGSVMNAVYNTSKPPGSAYAREITSIDSQDSRGERRGVSILDGRVAGVGGQLRRARVFNTTAIEGEADPDVMIVLSARQIDDTKSQILTAIMLATIMAIAIGAGVSFLLASQVTTPVRRLVEDIEIVASGDLEHRTLATSRDEIGILAQTFDIMTQKIQLAHGLELEHQAREHELNIATEIQSNLLPKKIPQLAGFDLGAFYRPSKEVGGDYYDFIQIDEDHLGIVVADVSGKGVPGSMVMTMARSLIRMEAVRNLSAADTFIKTNRVIAQDIKRGMFVTAMYVIINTRTATLQVASAGHNPLVLYRAKLKKCSLVNPKGIALGFDKGPIFERTITEEKVKLQPGDRVVVYTDGVPEAMSPENEEFGDKQFYKLVQDNGGKNSNQFVNLLVGALEEWKGNAEQSDDITICTFRLLGNDA